MKRLCASCRGYTEIAYADSVDRQYCVSCALELPDIGPMARAIIFLYLTVPYQVGDVVEARTAGQLYDGIGTVTGVYFDLEHGGSPIYPAFGVHIDQPADENAPLEGWYTENCLRRAELEPAG